MPKGERSVALAKDSRLRFAVMLVGAFVLYNIPYLRAPFMWFETYCHEMSHGLAALLTGGRIENLILRLNGSGLLWHSGSAFRPLVSFAGYSGAIGIGVVMTLGATRMDGRTAKGVVLAAAVIVFLSGLVFHGGNAGFGPWVVTAGITTFMAACLLALYRWGTYRLAGGLMQFIGLYVLISGIRAPFFQLGAPQSDAADLAEQTFIPAFVWVGAWALLGLLGLFFCYRKACLTQTGQNP
jgi:hypothetical protein